MNYSSIQIVLQEVPGQISICFSICGCNVRCKGCHSPILWKEANGQALTSIVFEATLNKYKELATCVLFMGGEWHKKQLITYLKTAKQKGYHTCLYTGEKQIDTEIEHQLTWIKTGKWKSHLGGLDSKHTNQNFKEVKTNKSLNHLFLKNY